MNQKSFNKHINIDQKMSLKVLLTLTLLSLLILVSVSSDPNESSESKLIGKVV